MSPRLGLTVHVRSSVPGAYAPVVTHNYWCEDTRVTIIPTICEPGLCVAIDNFFGVRLGDIEIHRVSREIASILIA